ncbi:hypothetical protein DFP72DRAFT_926258 [Ephemerocybe angulata]|uniref:Tim44-like domain-containing protein n=1 Tax=Ephemerocybe angulata TaxID=980116 RepID=A0A8H6LYP1_9AGAR|nr:hypothetical protein DFP72DRAFT_926258 [Tulosesus angulatus]
MALSVSRSCALRLRLSIPSSSSSSSPAFATCVTQSWPRAYATESAVHSKRRGAPGSAKATHKGANVSSAAPKKVSTKVEERAAAHAGPHTAVTDAKALAGSSSKRRPLSKAVVPEVEKAVPAAKAATAPAKELTVEEKGLQELEAIEYFKKVMRSADPFGQPIASSLDVMLVRPASPLHISKYASLGQWWGQLVQNRVNGMKSFMSMMYLAGDDAIPGVKLGRVPWYKSFGWLFKAGKSQSTKTNVWISPLRQIALETYRELNQNVAKGDSKAVKTLTAADYQTELLRRLKKQPANFTFRWTFEREVSPTQIVSLRAAQYHMGREDPKFGNRYLVHALVKFDTEQSLEIYGARGEPLHEVAEGATKRADGTVAAKPKRVTEYLVMEKRMWYDTPWVFREQKWEA